MAGGRSAIWQENPWTVVSDPVRIERESELHVECALPAILWERMRGFIDDQCQREDARYWRSVRVALLLGADSGLRREELASARRERLAPTTHGDGVEAVWQLQVIGKRKKERTVPVSPATIAALTAHWQDSGEDFHSGTAGPLFAPIFIPPGKEAQKKHAGCAAGRRAKDSRTRLAADEFDLRSGRNTSTA